AVAGLVARLVGQQREEVRGLTGGQLTEADHGRLGAGHVRSITGPAGKSRGRAALSRAGPAPRSIPDPPVLGRLVFVLRLVFRSLEGERERVRAGLDLLRQGRVGVVLVGDDLDLLIDLGPGVARGGDLLAGLLAPGDLDTVLADGRAVDRTDVELAV